MFMFLFSFAGTTAPSPPWRINLVDFTGQSFTISYQQPEDNGGEDVNFFSHLDGIFYVAACCCLLVLFDDVCLMGFVGLFLFGGVS